MTEPKWLKVARSYLGLHEIPGSQHEARIVRMFADSGHSWVKDDETAWCAAMVGSVLKQAGLKGTGKLDARSYLKWGEELKEPIPGCIVVFWRKSPNSWKGHVALFLKDKGDLIEVLGGNQSNQVSIAHYPKKRLLGYRWPEGISRPGDAPKVSRVQDPKKSETTASDAAVTPGESLASDPYNRD